MWEMYVQRAENGILRGRPRVGNGKDRINPADKNFGVTGAHRWLPSVYLKGALADQWPCFPCFKDARSRVWGAPGSLLSIESLLGFL